MAEPRISISSRRSQDSRSGASVSHGRGGAGNIYPDDTEYVDGGLIAVATPGVNGEGWSGGIGGAGNIARPSTDTRNHKSDRIDDINVESVIEAPKEGEGYSTGRGGAANVHAKDKNFKEGSSTGGTDQANAAPPPAPAASKDEPASLGLAYVDFVGCR